MDESPDEKPDMSGLPEGHADFRHVGSPSADWPIRIVQHPDLSIDDLAALRALFDSEYLADYGSWNPDQPYGYSPADVHVMVFDQERVIAHVGFQVRTITVGGVAVVVAGTGGVLVDAVHRARGVGRRAMLAAHAAMRADPRIAFGYLGCRSEVVPFYESAGWQRIHVTERCTSRIDQTTVLTETAAPLLVHPVHAQAADWPPGDVDLRGTPW